MHAIKAVLNQRVQQAIRHLESQESSAIRKWGPMKQNVSHHQNGERSCRPHRINVGPNPLVNALMPSLFHTVRTQCNVERYFCPSDGENPSVCIRDLTISIGYITAQSYSNSAVSRGTSYALRTTHSVACCRAIKDRASWAYLFSADTFLRHLTLYQLLICPKIDAVPRCLSKESNVLTFINTSYTILGRYLLNGIERTAIDGIRI